MRFIQDLAAGQPYVFDYSYKDLGLFNLPEFSGRNNKTGEVREMCKIRETPGKNSRVDRYDTNKIYNVNAA